MTGLEITLTTSLAVVWVLGAYVAYAGASIIGRMDHGGLSKIVTLVTWPFVVLWVICT